MAEALFSFERVLKIPCDDLAAGLVRKTLIDEQIKNGLVSLSGNGAELGCKVAEDPAGGLTATMTRGGYTIALVGRYGQNTVFVKGRKASFLSYSIRAEFSAAATDRTAVLGDHLILAGRVVGAVTVPLPVFWAMSFIVDKTGMLIVWVLPLLLATLFGLWCGGKVGESLALRLENRAYNRSVAGREAEQVEALWKRLTEQLDRISDGYEKV